MLLRVHKRKEPFFKAPDFSEPTWEAFKPNKQDVMEAKDRGRQEPGVSVFDECRTSEKQAVAIRDHFAQGTLGATRTLAITVEHLVRTWESYRVASVLTDPIIPADGDLASLPGACGHCIVEGLYEHDKKRRNGPEYKAMLDRLAVAAQAR